MHNMKIYIDIKSHNKNKTRFKINKNIIVLKIKRVFVTNIYNIIINIFITYILVHRVLL